MAFQFESPYSEQTEQRMRNVFGSLSEKDRRRYAAIESEKLGHGGQRYIAKLLDCSEHAIRRGASELDGIPDDKLGDRQRAEGGGRKPRLEENPEIEDKLVEVVDLHAAGDPDEPDIVWTHLSPQGIAEILRQANLPISGPTVANWMEENEIRRRKN